MANDGTSCGYNGNSYCIQGACRFVGCDGKLNGAKLDNCGVCEGDGSSCEKKEHTFDDHRSYNGKLVIKRVPVGATNIKGKAYSYKCKTNIFSSETIKKFKFIYFIKIRTYSWVHDKY